MFWWLSIGTALGRGRTEYLSSEPGYTARARPVVDRLCPWKVGDRITAQSQTGIIYHDNIY